MRQQACDQWFGDKGVNETEDEAGRGDGDQQVSHNEQNEMATIVLESWQLNGTATTGHRNGAQQDTDLWVTKMGAEQAAPPRLLAGS